MQERRGDLNRPVVWFPFYLDINAQLTTSPTPMQQESMVRTILAYADFDFEVDLAWIDTLQDPITIGQNKYYATYAALSPRPPPMQTTPTEILDTQLSTIEDFLICLFMDMSPLKYVPNPDDNISHYDFSLPSVNDVDHHLKFYIEGFDPSLIFDNPRADNIATHRELACDIFRSFRSSYNETFPNKILPKSIMNIKTQFATTSIISTRSSYIHSLRETIIGITFSSTNPLADTLKEAMTKLCVTHSGTLKIGGNKAAMCLNTLSRC